MTKEVSTTAIKKPRGRKLGSHGERLDRIENRLDWVIHDAFQTLANSVAEQASACQAMLKVLAELHPDRRMVKMADDKGRVYYEFKTIAELEAMKAEGEAAEPMEAEECEAQVKTS